MDDRARALLASGRHAALATLLDDGHPYASLVAFAADDRGPVLLLSDLAEHTRNLRRDARASLLLAEPGADDPLARPRATFVGRCAAAARGEVAALYLARHPEAAGYLELRDFSFWRLEVEAVRFVGGFGVMSWTPSRA
jgi:putative heme iron utilization protein